MADVATFSDGKACQKTVGRKGLAALGGGALRRDDGRFGGDGERGREGMAGFGEGLVGQ